MFCPSCETEVNYCQSCGADLRTPTATKVTSTPVTVGAAQPGLLKLTDGEVIMKTDYRESGRCICYIVDGGDVYWGDGESDLTNLFINDKILKNHIYETGGTYTVSAVLRNVLNQTALITTPFLIDEDISTRVFYVDISRSNDSVSASLGTSADPYDYGQLVDQLKVGSTGVKYDTFKLKGFRELIATNEIIETDTVANYNIDAWDLSAYGPWMIVKNDNHLASEIMSFVGASINGGIYYNKTYLNGVPYGTPLAISKMTNMYVVNQGQNSFIRSYAYQSEVKTLSAWTSGTDVVDFSYIHDDFQTG